MSSRDIEGENPLYLPQAKVYDACCGLGPAILVASEPPAPSTGDPHRDPARRRGGVFEGATALDQLKRTPAELVDWLFRENSFPAGCFLLTGTGIVPPDDFTLAAGDEVAHHDRPDRHPDQHGGVGFSPRAYNRLNFGGVG